MGRGRGNMMAMGVFIVGGGKRTSKQGIQTDYYCGICIRQPRMDTLLCTERLAQS